MKRTASSQRDSFASTILEIKQKMYSTEFDEAVTPRVAPPVSHMILIDWEVYVAVKCTLSLTHTPIER